MGITGGVGRTAWLVNESRARRPGLSRDPLARRWIPSAQRPAVERLWDTYAREVYPHDDLVCSVRSRAVLSALEAVEARHGQVGLVNVGAGFTSYPYLAACARTIELDLPEMVDVRTARASELEAAGVLPPRRVERWAVDLATPGGADAVAAAVGDLDGLPTCLVLEGLLYYLPPARAAELLAVVRSAQASLAAVVITFWPSAEIDHPVLRRQEVWFAGNDVLVGRTGLDPADVLEAAGSGAVHLDTEAQQRWADLQVVPADALVPEHLIWRHP